MIRFLRILSWVAIAGGGYLAFLLARHQGHGLCRAGIHLASTAGLLLMLALGFELVANQLALWRNQRFLFAEQEDLRERADLAELRLDRHALRITEATEKNSDRQPCPLIPASPDA